VDDALFAVEAAVVSQADDVRVRRQVDDLEQRVQTLESQVGVRIQRLAERLLRLRTS
jgi:tetrahydromethanopterin S-methyltransferase subunit G